MSLSNNWFKAVKIKVGFHLREKRNRGFLLFIKSELVYIAIYHAPNPHRPCVAGTLLRELRRYRRSPKGSAKRMLNTQPSADPNDERGRDSEVSVGQKSQKNKLRFLQGNQSTAGSV